jgi:hypothetical protein
MEEIFQVSTQKDNSEFFSDMNNLIEEILSSDEFVARREGKMAEVRLSFFLFLQFVFPTARFFLSSPPQQTEEFRQLIDVLLACSQTIHCYLKDKKRIAPPTLLPALTQLHGLPFLQQ